VRRGIADGKETVMALDAKISLDDNALYRHKDIQEMRDLNEEAPLEIEASKFNLNYIKLDGSIACLVNGAGLAMATMDIIQHFGGSPANFLDVGGGASKEQVTAAFKIILQRPEREGHSGEHFRRHHGLQRHCHRHRRGGQGNALENCRWSSGWKATTSWPAKKRWPNPAWKSSPAIRWPMRRRRWSRRWP
jgi:hypothetical protein